MTFLHPWWLIGWLALPLLWWWGRGEAQDLKKRFRPDLYTKMVAKGGGLSRRTRRMLLMVAIALSLVALARPVIEKGTIEVTSDTIDMVVGFDISRSMFADDIYPNRLTFAKRKFYEFLDDMKQARIGVVGFSSRAFLIAPLTSDFASLKYLVEHMGFDYVSLRGTDIMAPLQVTAQLLKRSKTKVLLLFTDGGDKKDFSREIAYAKKEGIKVFVYAVGTQKGGVMKTDHGVVRDAKGDIVVTRLNPAIATLAQATGGVYQRYTLGEGDMKRLARAIRSRVGHGERRSRTIHDREELFVYPLALAMLLFVMASTSWPEKKRRKSE